MAYRTPSPPVVRTLDVRPEPVVSTLYLSAIGVAFGVAGVCGLGLSVASVVTHGLDELRNAWPLVFFALVFAAVGAFLSVTGYRGLTTLVRFTLTDTTLVMDWRRGLRVLRSERIDLADLVDVAIDDTPSSAGTVHKLVVGTRLGDIALSMVESTELGSYTKKRDELTAFLDLPAR